MDKIRTVLGLKLLVLSKVTGRKIDSERVISKENYQDGLYDRGYDEAEKLLIFFKGDDKF